MTGPQKRTDQTTNLRRYDWTSRDIQMFHHDSSFPPALRFWVEVFLIFLACSFPCGELGCRLSTDFVSLEENISPERV